MTIKENEKIYNTIIKIIENDLIYIETEKKEIIKNETFKKQFMKHKTIMDLLEKFFYENEITDNEYYFFIEYYYIKIKDLKNIEFLLNLYLKRYD